jgi:Holliday junction DNA helicase RuvB
MSPEARRELLAGKGDGPAGTGGGAIRPVDPVAAPAEELDEASLRPRTLDEFVGQDQLTEHLRIVLEAARKRRQPVDHLLFAGPPGLG